MPKGPFESVCGTGWSATFIPDGYFAASFTGPCRAHDKCYETCGKTKVNCDMEFKVLLRQSCGGALNFTCIFVSEIYYSTVVYSEKAQRAYDNAQTQAECCRR